MGFEALHGEESVAVAISVVANSDSAEGFEKDFWSTLITSDRTNIWSPLLQWMVSSDKYEIVSTPSLDSETLVWKISHVIIAKSPNTRMIIYGGNLLVPLAFLSSWCLLLRQGRYLVLLKTFQAIQSTNFWFFLRANKSEIRRISCLLSCPHKNAVPPPT